MANLKAISMVAALVATCLAVKPPGFVEKPPVHDESPPRYSFEYEVRDPEGGAQGHTEVRRGIFAVGGYYTRLPGEGGAQRVSYYADDWGFHPVLVAYGGHGYNTRLAFGDKAVATANAAAGSGKFQPGESSINAIGVKIPHAVNPLPDLTQTGAAALAAEAPQIPDAANLVASLGQPPAPPQPQKAPFLAGPSGATFVTQAPYLVQPQLQQQLQLQQQPQFLQQPQLQLQHHPQLQFQQRPQLQLQQHPQQPQQLRIPVATVTSVRPAVPIAPLTPASTYAQVPSYAPLGVGVVGVSRPAPTSFLSTAVNALRPAVISQTASPIIVSTTPSPVTVVSHSFDHGNGGAAVLHGVSAPATSFISTSPQTVSKAPVIVPQYQTVTPATTVVSSGGDVESFKESSAAAAAAAASALSAAAASGSGGQVSIHESSFGGGQGEGAFYAQQTNHAAGGAGAVSSGSFLGSEGFRQQGNAGQVVGLVGQTEYSQGGGYHYQRPASGGLTYAPLGAGAYGTGQTGGVLGQAFHYTPYLTTGYPQGGFTYSPGYQTVYQTVPQYVFNGGASSSSSSLSNSQATSTFKNEGEVGGAALFTNNIAGSTPQGATSFQSQVDHTEYRQPSLPQPTVSGFQGIGLDVGTTGFDQQQTLVSTPVPQLAVEEEYNVTPRPERPIVVEEFTKSSPSPAPVRETSTAAPLEPSSPTFAPDFSSSTVSSVPSSVEVTTTTPFTSSSPITPFYSTFPSNEPCRSCQSTRSQEINLLTAPATDTTSPLDSELQQIFFPDSTTSLQVTQKEVDIDSTSEAIDVTPKPFVLEENIGSITTNQPTVNVQVLEEEATRASTFEGFSGSGGTREEVFSGEGGSNGQFLSGETAGNGQFYSGASGSGGGQLLSGVGNANIFSGAGNANIFSGAGNANIYSGAGNANIYSGAGNANIFSGASGSGAQLYSGSSDGSGAQFYSGSSDGSGAQFYSGSSGGSGAQFYSGSSGGNAQIFSGESVGNGQAFSGTSGSSGNIFTGVRGGGVEYYNGGGGGGIYSVSTTPSPTVGVSDLTLAVTPSPTPSVLYVDRPVAVPVPYAVPQLVPYAVKGSSASSYKERNGHRASSSSSGSYESSTPSVISVTQITKIRTSGRKDSDRGYVKQVVEESGSSSSDIEEEEVIVRGGSVKLGSGNFRTDESYYAHGLPPPPFRSSTLLGVKGAGRQYGDRIQSGRPRKLCIEYGGFKPPLVPSDPDYSQSINLR